VAPGGAVARGVGCWSGHAARNVRPGVCAARATLRHRLTARSAAHPLGAAVLRRAVEQRQRRRWLADGRQAPGSGRAQRFWAPRRGLLDGLGQARRAGGHRGPARELTTTWSGSCRGRGAQAGRPGPARMGGRAPVAQGRAQDWDGGLHGRLELRGGGGAGEARQPRPAPCEEGEEGRRPRRGGQAKRDAPLGPAQYTV